MASNIAIKITADTTALATQFALAKAESSALSSEINKLAREAVAAGGATPELTAQLQKLSGESLAAKAKVAELSAQMKSSFGTAGKDASAMGSAMEIALDGAKFLIFEEVARQALESVKKGFEATVGAAEEFGLSNAKFARIIGTTTTEAAGLSEALKGAGVSTEQYEGMALKLTETIGQHEDKFRKLGVATRDANKELVGGKAAFDAISAAMRENPSDAAAISYAAFGKRAKDAFDIMRVGEEDVQRNIEIMKGMGVQLTDTSGSAEQMERAISDSRVMWESLGIAIGQKVMPVATEFIEWAQGPGKTVLEDLGTALKVVVDTFVWLGATVDGVATGLAIPMAEMTDAVVGFGTVAYDVFTLKWSNVIPDARAAYGVMEADLKAGLAHMAADVEAYGAVHQALFGNSQPLKGGAYGATGGGVHGSGDDAAAKKAAEDARKIADERAQIEERAAAQHIATEERANETVLALGRETSEQWRDEANKLADDLYNIQLAALKKRETADAGNPVALAKDQAEEATLFQALEDRKDQIYEQYLQKRQAEDQTALQSFVDAKERELTAAKAVLNEQVAAGELSAKQRDLAEIHLTQSIQDEVLNRLQAEEDGLSNTTKEWEKADQQRRDIAAKFARDLSASNQQLAKDYAQEWAPVTAGFHTMVQGILSGNETLVQALSRGAQTVAEDWIEAELKQLEQTIFVSQAKAAANAAGDQTTVAEHAAAKSEAGAVDVASGSAQIMNDASKAAAGAYSAVVGIPIVGPVLAPIAAGTAFTAVAAFDTLTSFDVGTNYVPYDMKAQIHKGERIIPEADNRSLMDAINGGGSSDGGLHVHMHGPFVQAIDTQTGASMIKAHTRDIADSLLQHLRVTPSFAKQMRGI